MRVIRWDSLQTGGTSAFECCIDFDCSTIKSSETDSEFDVGVLVVVSLYHCIISTVGVLSFDSAICMYIYK